MTDVMLIIEDETLLGSELQRRYQRQGWEVSWVKNIAEAQQWLSDPAQLPLVVLSDMNLPDGNGLDLLEQQRQRTKTDEWIFLTGYGGVADSVRALRLGAFDFLTKPCDQNLLDMCVAGASRSARAQRRVEQVDLELSGQFSDAAFIGHSPQAANVREMLAKLCQVPFSALIISGETGTGKGLAARILHHGSERSKGPMVEINCAALPRELLESELFGHEAGAFTGAKNRRIGLMEQANGGTLFLDEIGEMDAELQTKLLKAIEERKIRRLGGDREIDIDINVMAASHQQLQTLVSEGRFRADLYHRLSVFQLELPPLRQRKQDLQDLVPHFVADYNLKAGKKVKHISPEVWQALTDHHWPGNVRELRNVVERCVLFSSDEHFPLQWLQLPTLQGQAPEHAPLSSSPASTQPKNQVCLPLDGSMALDDMDRFIIQSALELHDFNVTATARALGTTRETLRYRIQKYRLAKP